MERRNDPVNGDEVSFSGEVKLTDMIRLDFNSLERDLMERASEGVPVSCHLALLSMIFRKYEEQQAADERLLSRREST